MNRLDVKTSKLQLILAILLGLFFVPLGLMMIVNGLLKGLEVVPLALGFMLLIAFVVVVWLVRRGSAMSVKYFSEEGLTRNDGRSFAWPELEQVVNQIRITSTANNTKALWRTEIQFKNGESAWLLPMKVVNYAEVSEYVRNLPCEHAEVKV